MSILFMSFCVSISILVISYWLMLARILGYLYYRNTHILTHALEYPNYPLPYALHFFSFFYYNKKYARKFNVLFNPLTYCFISFVTK